MATAGDSKYIHHRNSKLTTNINNHLNQNPTSEVPLSLTSLLNEQESPKLQSPHVSRTCNSHFMSPTTPTFFGVTPTTLEPAPEMKKVDHKKGP